MVKERGKVTLLDEDAALRESQEAARDLMRTGAAHYLAERSLLVKQWQEGLF